MEVGDAVRSKTVEVALKLCSRHTLEEFLRSMTEKKARFL